MHPPPVLTMAHGMPAACKRATAATNAPSSSTEQHRNLAVAFFIHGDQAIGPLLIIAVFVAWSALLGRAFGGSWLPTGGRDS